MIDILSANNFNLPDPSNSRAEDEILNKLGRPSPCDSSTLATDNISAIEFFIDNLYQGCDDLIARETDTLDSLPFFKYGLVCRRLESGPKNNLDTEKFRIDARSLEWVGLSSKKDQGLAFYVLSQFTKTPNCCNSKNTVEDLLAADCCKSFTDEVLNDIPPLGGQIPFSVICRWLARKRHGI